MSLGDYSQSKINASHQSVSGQSGIYAGNDGYQIRVKGNTDLKGGIITSTQSAEDTGKNRFSTGTLTEAASTPETSALLMKPNKSD